MTIGERIRFLREQNNMTQTDVAKQIGIATQTIFKYEKNIVTNIPLDNIEKLSDIFGVTPAYIMGWEDNANFPSPDITEDYTTFAVIGEVAAGYDSIALEEWDGEKVDVPNSYLGGHAQEEYFVLKVKGDSMFPAYQEGDKVLVLKQPTLDYSGQVGVVLYDDEFASVKKIEYKKGEDWLRMVPINPSHPIKKISGEELEHCRILGIPKLLIREIEE